MINRLLAATIQKYEKPGFINLVYGPRRVGKTTLLHQLTDKIENKIWFNGDTEEARTALSSTKSVELFPLVGKYSTIIIDEAQRIDNIGLSLKILIDKYPDKKFYVTGSSSLELGRGLQEPLTGRLTSYRLYPLSNSELSQNIEPYQIPALLESLLTWGGYPQLLSLSTPSEKHQYLKDLVDSYLFRDLFALATIKQPEVIRKLATLLSHQVGQLVSYNELGSNLGIDTKTVIRYLWLLKQSFVIFELSSFSRNLRKELSKSKKFYFWDLGIRNVLAGQIDFTQLRSVQGQIWENFLAVERLKKLEYGKSTVTPYFWRTQEQTELDWIELNGESLTAYEFKYSPKRFLTPKSFRDVYHTEAQLITSNNYLPFIS